MSGSGLSPTTISDCITHCANENPSVATWNGQSNGNSGEAEWKLVTRLGASKEVWQDQRTGLIWSSLVSTGDHWCKAVASSSPSVYWRLPTIGDYKQADVDGIRHVMPDMGANGTAEWSASLFSGSRNSAWNFYSIDGYVYGNTRNLSVAVRCVAR